MSKVKATKMQTKNVDAELSSDEESSVSEPVVKKTAVKGKPVKKVVVEESSSDEEPKMLKKKTNGKAAPAKKAESSDEESSEVPVKKNLPKATKKIVAAKKAESDSEEESIEVVKAPVKKAVVAKKVVAKVESDSEEESSEVPVVKAAAKKVVAKADSDSEEESDEEVKVVAKPVVAAVATVEGHNELFVKNLGWNTSEDGLATFFGTWGTVTKVKILTNKEDGRSKGIGFVEFSSNEEAAAALAQMGSLNLDGRDIQVNYSGQKPPSTFGAGAGQGSYGAKPAYGGSSQGGYGGSSQGGDKHTCFIGNLPFKVSEQQIRNLLSGCGPIDSVRIAMDKETGKMKGFAHVDFGTADSVTAAVAMNGAELDGRQLKIDPSQGKTGGAGGRGGFGGGRGGGRGGFGGGRGGSFGGNPMARNAKSGAMLPPGGNKMQFDD